MKNTDSLTVYNKQ